MHILVVGNVLKDVYLNLDSSTEKFEQDGSGVSWLDVSFNASTHQFFSRSSNFAGAAISLEVLQKMGLFSTIVGSNFHFSEDGAVSSPTETHRYILTSEGGVSYLVPSNKKPTIFIPPTEPVDWLYIDRSAELSPETIDQITAFLSYAKDTKLALYIKNPNDVKLLSLAKAASVVFIEKTETKSDYALSSFDTPTKSPIEGKILAEKIFYISTNSLSHLDIAEPISVERIDTMTHLSAYSIAAATLFGALIIGKSNADALKMARLNVENSNINSCLSLNELESLMNVDDGENLALIAKTLVLPKKGILAADESGGSIKKKFENLDILDTFKNRHVYRDIFLTAKDIEKYLNGVILFDETARDHAENNMSYPEYLTSRRIIPGIKVDEGLETYENSTETYTKGLENLETRLREYYQMGLRFAKWRAAFNVTLDTLGNTITPSTHAIEDNCRILAEYAKKCQFAGLVPIVEPEVVYDGDYPIETCAKITGRILDELFKALSSHNVSLPATILKVNMVLAGKRQHRQSTPQEVGEFTARTLRNHVPEDLAGIVFLSGGQTSEQALENLKAITKQGPYPWPVTFSFARALQDPALYTWAGNEENLDIAAEAFIKNLENTAKVL